MYLFIEVKDGQPINHPAFSGNLMGAFKNIPENWEPFIRVERPVLGIYETMDSEEPSYEKVDGVWTDVWSIRNMTPDEKLDKQQSVIDALRTRRQAENWAAWVLDEATCAMVPPIPHPELVEGVLMLWCGAENNWKEAPPRPGNNYEFDFLAWQWVAV